MNATARAEPMADTPTGELAPKRPTPPDSAPPPAAMRKNAIPARRRLITPARVGFLLTALAIGLGWSMPTERYISPENGVGYALGIIGGSAMLLLLVYPLRKRFRWLGVLGTIKGWFQLHMVLGVVGPVLVLYHSNFSLGATNSNAALFSMLIVSGSGVFGRFFYARIHHGLYGRRASRAELQAAASELRGKVSGWQFVPDLLARLDEADARLLAWRPGHARSLVRPLFVTWRMYRERWQLQRLATTELRAVARQVGDPERHRDFELRVHRYIATRLQATREVAEFESYERLFSLWHVLHLPLFFMLVIAGIVHVISVNIY